MHIHILGICGTFMGGVAALARAAGHEVSGSDRNVYPPMSTQLQRLGIELIEGYEAGQLSLEPDLWVVGNVMSRGMPIIEALLDRGLPYVSGPQWLAEHVLRDRWVLAVAGTHGKTTTSSLLAWILEAAGREPGFLIGGIPQNFGISARLGGVGSGPAPFVIEADEYDTAFFDKRAKFVHYRPRTVVLNNLEFDHADIYPDLPSIERQFQYLLRTVPGNGRVVCNAAEASLQRVLAAGCWTPVERFGVRSDQQAVPDWQVGAATPDHSEFDVLHEGQPAGQVRWSLLGAHNASNALAALAAAHHAGVPVREGIEALGRFQGVARRLQLRGEVGGVRVYDDFAHHPTAIAATIEALRARIGSERLIAVLEPRSASMRLGVYRDSLGPALRGADQSWLYAPSDLGWDARAAVSGLGSAAQVFAELPALLAALTVSLRAGDHVLIMSNGGFGGLHARLLEALAGRFAATGSAAAGKLG